MFRNARWSTIFTSLLLAGSVGTACVDDDVELGEDTEELTTYTARVKSGTLTLTGGAESSKLTLRLGAAPMLAVDVGDDGTADYTFDRNTFTKISISAGGGADVIRIDESSGAFTHEEAVTIDAGTGNDTVLGGIGAESITAGSGDDIIVPGRGADVISLGGGTDEVRWAPGDGSKVLDGGDGADRLVVDGSSIGEAFDLSASGARLRFTRDVGAVVLDADAIERVVVRARGGADRVTVHELATTDVADVDVDLSAIDGAAADGQSDVVTIAADAAIGPGGVTAKAEGAAVLVEGAAARVHVTGGEVSLDRVAVPAVAVTVDGTAGVDALTVLGTGPYVLAYAEPWGVGIDAATATSLTVRGLGGDDRLSMLGQPGLAPVRLDGGDGNDTVLGGAGVETLLGGAGNDLVDGNYGADVISLGDGDDNYNWDPGDGSDVVEGDAGTDTLTFHGSNIGEDLHVLAAGARVRVTRDIAAVTLDTGGLERVAIGAVGGTDTITVHELFGTTVTDVAVDLSAAIGGGDQAADVVWALGGATASITMTGDAGAVIADGLGARLRVTGGEPSLDRLAMAGELLTVAGTDGADAIDVVGSSGRTLVLPVGWTIPVDSSAADRVRVAGLGGADSIRVTGAVSGGPMELDGGDGDDTIQGGYTAETLIGGPGADTIDGGLDADVISLGDGDDTYTWDPGDGNDVVDGGAGVDKLRFSGSNIGEVIAFTASSGRLRVTRDVATVTLDAGALERVEARVLGGADRVTVGDLSGTTITAVELDLASSTGGGDAQADVVIVQGSAAADTITALADAGTALVTGLAATTRIATPEPTDQLVVEGGAGPDALIAGPGLGALLTYVLID